MTKSRIMESINTAKEIIVNLMESEKIVFTEECNILGKITVLEYTLAECVAYRTENAAYLFKNLLLNTRNTLPIRTRIALAAVLETCSFVPNENALIPVYFKKTVDLIPVYKFQTIYPEIGNLYLDGTINSDEFYKISKNHRVMVDNIMALFN